MSSVTGRTHLPDADRDSEPDSESTPLGKLPGSPDEFLTDQDRRELRAQLDLISRKRREAEAESQNLRIG